MKEKYVCSICGRSYTNLDDYLNCVVRCGEKLKKEKAAKEIENQKRLEEINAAINGVKQAKIYYEGKLKEFKEKYPREYELNFSLDDGNNCPADCKGAVSKIKDDSVDKSKDKAKSIELSYIDDGNHKPEMSARINGKKVNNDELDPDIKYLAKLFGIM